MRLVRLYPPAWRARYGDELIALLDELEATARMSWRVRLDVVRGALVERAHAANLSGLSPRHRAREGALRVLYAWTLFMIAGLGVEKASEHWQAVTPTAKRGLPTDAFDVVVVTAGVGSIVILLGVALALPSLAALLRAGGWTAIRRPIIRSTLLSLLTISATLALVLWAHSLTPEARNGHNDAYTMAFLAWLLLVSGSLFAWAIAAAATARQLVLPASKLRLEVWLGAAASASMAVITVATGLWWESLARAAPWFFDGSPTGSSASAMQWGIAIPAGLMLCAAVLGLTGATSALRSLPRLAPTRVDPKARRP